MSEYRPAISICIPTFNGEKYIHETISSVLNQTFRDFEIVISDDGSTDKTLEIVRSFSDNRIAKIDSLSRVGAEFNWNNAVNHASGKLVKLLCQDDLLYADCLANEVAVMSIPENEGASFCFHQRDLVTPSGKIIKARTRQFLVGDMNLSRNKLIRQIVRSGSNPIGEPMAVVFRSAAFKNAGQFNGDYVIDLDMWVRLLDQGKALFIAKHLSAFRISKTSWTSSLTKSQFKIVRAFDLQMTKNNPEIVTQNDLRLGLANNILRTFLRQFASKVILFVDRFFGSTR